jgi:hypothetical protein
MLKSEGILALVERLRNHGRRASAELGADLRLCRASAELGADLRLAAVYLRRLAALAIADEAASEREPVRKRQLQQKALELWGWHRERSEFERSADGDMTSEEGARL